MSQVTPFIRISRHITSRKDYLSGRFDRTHAWLDLILMANDTDQKVSAGSREIIVQRGQLCKSERYFSDRWHWSLSTVRRYLRDLEMSMQIYRERDGNLIVTTIANYDKYQGDNRKRKQPLYSQKMLAKNTALLELLDTENDNYGKFVKWIHDVSPDLIFGRMEMPSRDMFDFLREKYGPIAMRDVIADMVNQPSTTRKYVMLGTTMKNWLRRRNK